jgi:cell division protein FtsW (lipid II flippase)
MVNSRSPFFMRYRWKELGLLIIPFLILIVGMIQLLLVQGNVNTDAAFNTKYLPPIQALVPIFGFIGVLLIANLIMSIRFRKADQVLLPLAGLLTGIGVLMATRLGPDTNNPTLGSHQLLYAFISVVVCLLTIFFLRDTSVLSRFKYTWAVASLAFMIPSFISGVLSFRSGAPTHDSLSLGPIQLQPSEFLKITIVIFFAGYLSENREILSQGYLSLGKLRLPPLRQLGPMVLMLLVALMFFLIVRELGVALLIYGLFLSLTYLGSGKLTYVLAYLGIFVLLGYIGYSLLGYVKLRFATVGVDVVNWTAASEQAYQGVNGAYQVVQGLIALSSGGILGAGLGQGHPALVPVIQSDMIWTALGEELGLAGMMGIIGIYLFIVYRGFRIAIEAADPFNQLLAAGLTSIFAIQTLLIAAGNMKFMPLTGMPLPFLSAGGSSLFTNFIIIGILLRISHNNAMEREGLA